MKEIHIEPNHRVISILALLQVGVVFGGTLFVRTMLKVYGYGTAEGMNVPFRPGSVFIRHFGFFLFLVPITWTILAVGAARLSAHAWQWQAMLIAGTALIGLGAFCYFILGVTAPGSVTYGIGQ